MQKSVAGEIPDLTIDKRVFYFLFRQQIRSLKIKLKKFMKI